MTAQQLSKIWTVLSLVPLYYALNTYLVTQGGNEIFGAKLIVSNRVPAAMMGIPICSVLLLLSSLIGVDYALKNGPARADRIPVIGFETIDTGSREGKLYQGTMFGLMSILPIFPLAHFWVIFCNADVVTTGTPSKRIPSIWSWSALGSLDDPARICTELKLAPEISCEKNITLLPGLEPTIFAVLTAAAVAATLVFLWLVIRKRSSFPTLS
jgi:hypothetical protein